MGKLEYAMNDLQYPEMREELVEYLKSLSDREYQIRVWVNKEYPTPKYYDNLTMTLQLFEDLGVFRDPVSRIGTILKNHEEASALARLSRTLDTVFSLYGNNLSDSDYVRSAEWDDVVAEASRTLEIILSKNP